MKTKDELIRLLQSILKEDPLNKIKLIIEFQNEIWDDKSITDEKLSEFLSELAYDMDFYEPNENWQKEVPNYYGNERLDELVRYAIRMLQSHID